MASPVKEFSDNPLHYPVKKEKDGLYGDKNDCFYNMCEKKTYFSGLVVCGTFKKRNDRIYCYICSLMTLALFIAVIAPLILFRLVDVEVDSEVVIDSTSAANYESWQTNAFGSGFDDVKISYQLFYFDVQNAADILSGAQPVVVEVGPYAFDEYFVKFDIEWTDGGDTVTYNTQKYYIFNQEKSGPGLTQTDQLTLPYPTVIGFQYLLEEVPPEVNEMIDQVLELKITQGISYLVGNLTVVYSKLPENPPRKFDPIRAEINATIAGALALEVKMLSFIEQSNTLDLLLKTLLCGSPYGISPFFKVNPVDAWFGWLKDPVLSEVEVLLMQAEAKTGKHTAWTNAVPGASTNWTSIEETRRRRLPDTFKTGKKNKNQVSQYVRYNGMDTDQYHVCVVPMNSQDESAYDPATQFPACEHWDNSWNESVAEAKGYHRPFATPYANRLQGTDANMYGRPVRSEKIAVFVSDIYRSLFIEHQADVDWHGITLKRFGLQTKDMLNATANPENAQYYNFAPSGMENTTSAAGIPVFVSFPHFYLGDDRLVSAIKGLDPNFNRHETFIDVEPQTGLLVHAEKKLQVNYLMESKYLPQTQPDALIVAGNVCQNVTDIIAAAIDAGVDPSQLPDIQCGNAVVEGLLTCWSQPSDWQFQDGQVYFPYGWASEAMVLPDSTADDLNNSLFLIDDIAADIRFWSLIVAGICFAALIGMSCYSYNAAKESREEKLQRAFQQGSIMISGQQPLLDPSAPDTRPEYEPHA